MDTFFRLPSELQSHVLTQLAAPDLDRLFQLDLLAHALREPYLIVRHAALWAKHHRRSLVMSNDVALSNFAVGELRYLVEHDLVVSPRDLTFALFDFTNYRSLLTFACTLFDRYLPYLHRCTREFNIRLILVENVSVDNVLLRRLFRPLRTLDINVRCFTIKYLPAFGQAEPRPSDMAFDLAQCSDEIAVENLSLHLFNSTHLLKHLVNSSGCFYCDSLRTLDLSYNGLSDRHLRNIVFPPRLECLNLSNNSLLVLFPLRTLVHLVELDLSNNNLMRIEPPQWAGCDDTYALRKLNLSGNLISNYAAMFRCPFFAGVDTLDLSRNLLEGVSAFPLLVRNLDVSGNYFVIAPEIVRGVFPRSLERLCVSNSSGCSEEFARLLVHHGELWLLRELRICGSEGL